MDNRPDDGHHRLTAELAQEAIASLFKNTPDGGDRVLIVGGAGQLLEAMYSSQFSNVDSITTVAIEVAEDELANVRENYSGTDERPQILRVDFETADLGEFEYVVLFPPSAPAHRELSDDDYKQVRERYKLKRRFDLSSIYLANGLSHLASGGRLVAVLPTSFLSVESASQLRRRLADDFHVESIQLISPPEQSTDQVFKREGDQVFILSVTEQGEGVTEIPSGQRSLPKTGQNWARAVQDVDPPAESEYTLDDVTRRIGAGISTGADDVFIFEESEMPPQFDQQWIYPVIGGRDLAASETVQSNKRIITPYRMDGTEVSFEELEETGEWLKYHRSKLENRASRRGQPWYAWIRRPPMEDLLRQKLLARDFTNNVKFYLDDSGEYIPRRSVFYIVPSEGIDPNELLTYLNQPKVSKWIEGSSLGDGRMTRLSVGELRNIPVPSDSIAD